MWSSCTATVSAFPFAGARPTEVLIRLALEAGVMVRTERLIEDLWADEAVATARNTLQTKVSRLRRALGDPALVTGTSAGYTLEIDPGAVDALEVLRLADQASSVSSRGRPVGGPGSVRDRAGHVQGRHPLGRG